MTSVTIPDSVTSIGALAFAKVPIKTLVVGKGLADQSSVGGGAFYGVCPTLESVSINSPNALGRGSQSKGFLPWLSYQNSGSSYYNDRRGDYIYEGLHFTQGSLFSETYSGARLYGTPRDPTSPVSYTHLTLPTILLV